MRVEKPEPAFTARYAAPLLGLLCVTTVVVVLLLPADLAGRSEAREYEKISLQAAYAAPKRCSWGSPVEIVIHNASRIGIFEARFELWARTGQGGSRRSVEPVREPTIVRHWLAPGATYRECVKLPPQIAFATGVSELYLEDVWFAR